MDDIKKLQADFLKQVRLRHQELTQELSQCDLAISDALHYLENERCDAVSMVKTAKLIKELRHKRRGIKVKHEQALCLINAVKTKKLTKFEKRTDYTYRTTVMDDIRHKN